MRRVRVLSQAPRVWLFEGFVRPFERAFVRETARDLDALAREGVDVQRSVAGRSFELPVAAHPLFERLQRRVHRAVGLSNDHGATLRFRRYERGERHPLHTDSYVIEGSTLVATAMLCLNTPEDGGETVFPFAEGGPLRVRPVAGNLLFWFNHAPDGALDLQARHEGAAVREGVKITLTEFFYRPVASAKTNPALARAR